MMTATKCPTAEQLKDLSLGRIAAEQSEELVAHINTCTECQAGIETLDDAEDSLIVSLRTPGELDKYQGEPNCEIALSRALGALAGCELGSGELPAEVPKQIGEYEIVRPLGRGGMGSVYLARHTKLGREVALKVVAHNRLGDQRVRDRFETEMRSIGQLSHPNVVTAHDAREVAGTAVLVTEFIDGLNLGQLLKRTGPLTVANACEIIRQTAVALEYTSSQGFVHRDVKPSNIMLGRDGTVKLLDLGLARFQFGDEPEMTGTGQAMGTADFIAPEQVADSRTVDVRADIYSLGCTLYKLLTGVAPFSGGMHTTAFAKMTAHISTPAPALLKNCPAAPMELGRVVDSMLAKEPTSRPQTGREVADQLASFAVGHNLPDLVRVAEESSPAAPLVGGSPFASSQVVPQRKPFLQRNVPASMLIAASLAALLVGFALGLIVKITYPDGTTVTQRVPEGSKIDVSTDDAKATSTQPTASSPVAQRSAEPTLESSLASMPMFFAVLKPESWHAQHLRSGVEFESGSYLARKVSDGTLDGKDPFTSGTAIWCRVDERIVSPEMMTNFGTTKDPWWTAIEPDASAIIPWPEIFGHLSAQSDGRTLQLFFDASLSDRMRRLSESHLNRQLAIVIDGKIAVAPKIVAPIRDQIQVPSQASRESIVSMMQSLTGMVMPIPNRVDIGDDTERRYNGKKYADWLRVIRREAEPTTLRPAIVAMSSLVNDANTVEAGQAILDVMKTHGLPVVGPADNDPPETVARKQLVDAAEAALLRMDSHQVLTLVLDEVSSAKSRQFKEFLLRFVNEYGFDRNPSVVYTDANRFGAECRKQAPLIVARLVQELGVGFDEQWKKEWLVSFVGCYGAGESPDPELQEIVNDVSKHSEWTHLPADNVIPRLYPDTPGLAEQYWQHWEGRPNWYTTSDEYQILQHVPILGKHAAPIIPKIANAIQRDFVKTNGYNDDDANHLLDVLNGLGMHAKESLHTLQKLHAFNAERNDMEDRTKRIADTIRAIDPEWRAPESVVPQQADTQGER